MKILHIIDSLATGGAEKLLIDTVVELNNTVKADVALLDGKDYPFHKNLAASNLCRIFILGKGSVYNPLLVFKIIPYLRLYDIIHVHLFPAQYWVVFAKLLSRSNVKLIFTEHSTSNRRLTKPLLNKLEKFIYKRYSKIICITDQVATTLKSVLSINTDKLEVINNGIKLDSIGMFKQADRISLGYGAQDIIIIMVAGFRIEKDQECLIRTLSKLPIQYKLLLVGDGPRRNACELLSAELECQDRIKFLGIRNDVYSLLKMANIAVLSSHWEGFGLAAVEAMACGTPLIASNVPGLAQVVDGGGLLFEKGNSNDLASLIKQLIEDRDLYLKISNLGKIKANQYDIKSMITKLIQLYKNCAPNYTLIQVA